MLTADVVGGQAAKGDCTAGSLVINAQKNLEAGSRTSFVRLQELSSE